MDIKSRLVPVSILVHWRIRKLMKEAVRRGDYSSMSEIGRLAIEAWEQVYADKLARGARNEAERRPSSHHEQGPMT